MKIDVQAVKVLMGLDVGIRYSSSEIELKEHQAYKDISGIKISHDSHYCIVTLKDHVEFNEYVAPLCLPEMNKQHYESDRGQKYSIKMKAFVITANFI